MGRILEDAEIAFLKNCAKAREAAVRNAAKEIKKDFKEKVFDQAVSDYYEDYDPARYRRTHSLYKVFKVDAPTDGRYITINYDWDFNRLPRYRSKSRYHKSGGEWKDFWERDDGSKNGIPEKGWIFGNFMEGIHPKFSYSKEIGAVVDNSEQYEQSYIRIKNYKDDYISNGDMKNILLKHLKRQCKNL